MSESTTEMTGAMIDPVTGEIIDQKELAERLLAQAKEQGVSLVGPGALLNQLTRNVLESALEAEHLGHEHGQRPIAANMRNGTRSKTVLTEIGPVEIEVPRDRDGSFEPVIVRKRKRRLDGIDQSCSHCPRTSRTASTCARAGCCPPPVKCSCQSSLPATRSPHSCRLWP